MSDLSENLQKAISGSAFTRNLGLQVESWDAHTEALRILMPFSPDIERMKGSQQVHGGAIAALIDTAATFALVAREKTAVPTIDLRIDYLRPAISTALIAEGRVRRAGKTIGVVDVEVSTPAGALIATGRGVFGLGAK